MVQTTLPRCIEENAEAELTTTSVLELDDAAEAVKILTDLKQLWKSADPGQRNRLLLAVFHSIYVVLENREVVGFRPMKAFNALLQAMDYREDVEVWPTPYGKFTRDGGDGGGRGSSVLTWPFNVRLRRSSPSKQRTISGPVIKQSRIALRISQTDLAASLGIDRQTLRSWEKGDTVPSRRYQNLLLKCLDARVQT